MISVCKHVQTVLWLPWPFVSFAAAFAHFLSLFSRSQHNMCIAVHLSSTWAHLHHISYIYITSQTFLAHVCTCQSCQSCQSCHISISPISTVQGSFSWCSCQSARISRIFEVWAFRKQCPALTLSHHPSSDPCVNEAVTVKDANRTWTWAFLDLKPLMREMRSKSWSNMLSVKTLSSRQQLFFVLHFKI